MMKIEQLHIQSSILMVNAFNVMSKFLNNCGGKNDQKTLMPLYFSECANHPVFYSFLFGFIFINNEFPIL